MGAVADTISTGAWAPIAPERLVRCAMVASKDQLSDPHGEPVSAPDIIAVITAAIALVALAVSFANFAWVAKQLRLNSSIQLVDWLEKVRDSRNLLYRLRDSGKPLAEWTDADKKAANVVCRQLDVLGIFDQLGFVDQRFADRFYAIPAKEMWDICQDWVENERLSRGPQHLWELERLATRVSHVKSNHPAIAGRTRWRRRPRRPA